MNAFNFLAREPGTSLQSDAKERPFDLRELRYFHSVARTGNFGRSARELNVSQPAISHQVRKLEEGMLDEQVLGMTNVPNLERMQQLAGIQPAEIAVQPQSSGELDTCAAADQVMEMLDMVAAILPNVRLADLKAIRQRIVTLQTSMNESA